MFVGGIFIEHQVEFSLRIGLIKDPKKLQEILVFVVLLAFPDYLTGGHIESRKECCVPLRL
jgi:hypothetical protein